MMSGIEDLEQHLLFHKSIADDEETYRKIESYMEILSQTGSGEKLSDPVDESIRSVFSLVLEKGLDPWEIDLSEFAKLYSDKVRLGDFDMIVAGKLLFMAWKILKLQSDSARERSEPPPEPEYEPEDEPYYEEYEPLPVPDVDFKGAFRREPVRPVTVLELIDAFEDVRKEMEIFKERERVREAIISKTKSNKFDNKAHEEDDEKTVEAVWAKIAATGLPEMNIRALYGPDLNDNLSVFISLLHLVRDGFIDIMQTEYPGGEIRLVILRAPEGAA